MRETDKQTKKVDNKTSNVEKSGEHVNSLQIVTTEICHSSREDTHNYNGRITRSRAKYLESEFNSSHHLNQETNATVVHSTLNKVMDRNSMINDLCIMQRNTVLFLIQIRYPLGD